MSVGDGGGRWRVMDVVVVRLPGWVSGWLVVVVWLVCGCGGGSD